MTFTKKDIEAIRRRTNRNFHGENMEIVAKKIQSPLAKEFHEINAMHKKIGYLPYDLSQKRYGKFIQLKGELKKKLSQKEFNDVWGGF